MMDRKLTAAAQCLSLSGKASDQVMELSGMFKSYLALQRFVSPEYVDEAEVHVQASRAELGAMIETLNAEALRRLDALADTMSVLSAQARLNATCAPTT